MRQGLDAGRAQLGTRLTRGQGLNSTEASLAWPVFSSAWFGWKIGDIPFSAIGANTLSVGFPWFTRYTHEAARLAELPSRKLQ